MSDARPAAQVRRIAQKVGRPPKPPETRRRNIMTARMNDAEADLVIREAIRRRLSISDFIRIATLSVVEKERPEESGTNLGAEKTCP